jgi:hypothetical protein
MDPEDYLQVHKRPALIRILSQMNSIQTVIRYFFKTYVNNILALQLLLGLTGFLFPSSLLPQPLYAFVVSPMRTTCFAHLIALHI